LKMLEDQKELSDDQRIKSFTEMEGLKKIIQEKEAQRKIQEAQKKIFATLYKETKKKK